MPKKSQKKKSQKVKFNFKGLLNFVAWLTGMLISLVVGFSMIGRTLMLPSFLGGVTASIIIGWVIVVATFVGLVTAIFNK